jgi:hypothetical protein
VVISWAQTSSSTRNDEEEAVVGSVGEAPLPPAEEEATRRARKARQSVSTPATGKVSGTGEKEDEGRSSLEEESPLLLALVTRVER